MTWDRLLLCALLGASLTGIRVCAAARADEAPTVLFRYSDVDEAWNAAQDSQRPILVFVSSGGCHHCRRMVAETFSHPQIAEALREGFEAVSVVRETQPELVKRLGIRQFPTTLVISPDGELIARIDGFAERQKFATRVRTAMATHDRATRTAAARGRTQK